MPYKNIEDRRKKYAEKKDEINSKRREYNKRPEVRKRKSEKNRIWREENREELNRRNRIYKKVYDEKAKKKVFDHYGRKCACCGESVKEFLTIDHINGEGTKHRKKIGRKMYNWLVQNNLPKGFQTLCFNCNWGKHVNGGVCPHKNLIDI